MGRSGSGLDDRPDRTLKGGRAWKLLAFPLRGLTFPSNWITMAYWKMQRDEGGMAEWFKAAVLKTVERKFRGFESYSLRHSCNS